MPDIHGIFHGFDVEDIRRARYHAIVGPPSCLRHDREYAYEYAYAWLRCTCEDTPDVPAWVMLAFERTFWPRWHRPRESTAFRHNHAKRIAPKPARAKVRRFRNIERSQYGESDKRAYLRPRFEDDERAHMAEALADAREAADMAAIEVDGYALARDWHFDDVSWCEIARFMPEVDARTCGCWACEARLLDIEHDLVTQADEDTLVSLMEAAPNGAPVVPVLA